MSPGLAADEIRRRKCVELEMAISGHSVGFGTGTQRSISNYVFNHLGNFASAGEAIVAQHRANAFSRYNTQEKLWP